MVGIVARTLPVSTDIIVQPPRVAVLAIVFPSGDQAMSPTTWLRPSSRNCAVGGADAGRAGPAAGFR